MVYLHDFGEFSLPSVLNDNHIVVLSSAFGATKTNGDFNLISEKHVLNSFHAFTWRSLKSWC